MKNLINAYIIEDELTHGKIMKESLMNFSKQSNFIEFNVHLLLDYASFYEDLDSLPFLDTDLFIIDIHLHTFFNGIELAQKIRQKYTDVAILFITSDSSKGIEVINKRIHPLGYVVKRPTPDLFFQEEFYALLRKVELNTLTNEENSLLVRSGRKQLLFKFSEIYYIAALKSQKNRVEIKTTRQQVLCDAKLSALKADLADPCFFTDLKSYIINFDSIQSYNLVAGTLTFKDQSELSFGPKVITKISRAFRSYLERNPAK